MSVEMMLIPMIADLAALLASCVEEHKRTSVTIYREHTLLTPEEEADMRAEIDSLQSAGCNVQTNAGAGSTGASVLIHTDRGYDIGLKRNDKGAYDVVAHWSQDPGKAQVQQVNDDMQNRIRQRYAYEKVKRELAKKGFIISTEEVQPDNTIRLVARKW